jgi:hypothetical protein
MTNFVKKPCSHCPYRKDVKPFLHPQRGEELAYHSTNPYNTFPCHKTTEYDEEYDDMVVTQKSKECAGFLTLQIVEGKKTPDGFTPSFDIVYNNVDDMADAYLNQNKKN